MDCRHIHSMIISVVLLTLVSSAHAAMKVEVGQVVAIRGPVTAELKGEVRSLAIKSPVFQADVIKTERRSRIQIRFKDNTIITLGVASTLHLKEYRWNEETKKGVFTHEVKEGVFRVLGGAMTKDSPEQFKTETPVATIGIRGSLYRGRLRNGTLKVMLQGGRGINVINDTGIVPILTPGFGTRVASRNEKPARPFRFSSEDISEMDAELADEGFPEADEESREGETPEEEGTDGEAPEGEDGDSQAFASDSEGEEAPVEEFAEYSAADEGTPAPPVNLLPLDEILTDIPDPPLTIPPPSIVVSLSGKGASATTNASGEVSSYIMGSVSAINTDGVVSGTLTDTSGASSAFSYTIPGFDPDAPYTGFNVSQSTYDGITRDVQSSPSGEFSIFTVPGSTYYELGFAGVEATSPPTDGVDIFVGNMLAVENATLSSPPEDWIHFGKYMMEINWKTGTYIAYFDETNGETAEGGKGPAFFGRISGTAISSAHMIGPSFEPDDPMGSGVIEWGNLSGISGDFYGSSTQGMGFSATGSLINIENQAETTGTFEVVGAAMLKPDTDDPTSPTGTLTFNGFVTGISEDMANPSQGRGLFLNSTVEEVSIVLNRDTGTVTGSIYASDLSGNTGDLSVTIGPGGQSAFVLEDHFAAYLGDGTPASASITDLKSYGNFLITAPFTDEVNTPIPGHQFSEHVQWGYWEVAYQDPASGKDYHLHNPGSLWIAGDMTSDTYVKGLLGTDTVLTYSGIAEGIRIGSDAMISQLTGGSSNITIDFNSTTSISGSITFDQVNLDIGFGSVENTGTGFTATFGNMYSSQVNGGFFGPQAEAIGGNFKAEETISGPTYIGIFGGNKQ